MSGPIPMTADRLIEYTPPALEAAKPKPIFYLRVATPDQRDRLASTMLRLGLRTTTQEVMRATIIDALWDVFPAEDAEEKAVMLETFWQNQAVDEAALQTWAEQEIQRRLDLAAGAKGEKVETPAPAPMRITPVRVGAQARILVDHMQKCSARIVDMLAEQMDYGRANAIILARLNLAEVRNLDGKSWKADLVDGVATEESIMQIRSMVDDDAWAQVVGEIDRSYSLSEDERKNSVSPLEKQSDQTGSPEPSGDLESSDGKSTGSSTTPAPTDGSDQTTE